MSKYDELPQPYGTNTSDAAAQRKLEEDELRRRHSSAPHREEFDDNAARTRLPRSISSADQGQSGQSDNQQPSAQTGPFKPWGRVARFAAAIFAVAVTGPFIGPAALLVGIAAYNAPEIANGAVNLTKRVIHSISGLFGRNGSANITQPGVSTSIFTKDGRAHRAHLAAAQELARAEQETDTARMKIAAQGQKLEAALAAEHANRVKKERKSIAKLAKNHKLRLQQALEDHTANNTHSNFSSKRPRIQSVTSRPSI